MDEIEVVHLHKRCNKKARKVSQPKKSSESLKSNEPKIVSGAIDDPSEKGQKSKKTSRSSNGKKTATKAGKKVKRTPQPKKHQSHLNLLTQAGKKKKGDKGKKTPPLLGVKEEVQSFFYLQKDSKNLAIEKKAETIVFMVGPYEGYEVSYVALCDTKYLKRMLKMSGLEKKTKDLINNH